MLNRCPVAAHLLVSIRIDSNEGAFMYRRL